jgi:hypothetical protein
VTRKVKAKSVRLQPTFATHTHIRKTAKMEEEGIPTISVEIQAYTPKNYDHQRKAENVYDLHSLTSDYRTAILLQS